MSGLLDLDAPFRRHAAGLKPVPDMGLFNTDQTGKRCLPASESYCIF